MAELADVIDRLKAEGDLNRNSGANSLKSVKQTIIEENEKLIAAINKSAEENSNSDAQQGDSAQQEENRREAKKEQSKLIKGLTGLVSTMNKFESTLNKMVDSAAKSAVGLGVLGLFMSPDMMVDVIFGTVQYLRDFFTSIGAAVKGDFGPLMTLFQENMLATGAIFTLIITKLGVISKIAKVIEWSIKGVQFAMIAWNSSLVQSALSIMKTIAVGAWTKTIALLGWAINGIRVFMMGTLIPALTGMLSGLATAIAPILIAAAPFIALGALIAAGLYLLYKAYEYFDIGPKISKLMKEIGDWITTKMSGVIEALGKVWTKVTGGMGLIGLITAPVRLAGDWIAEKFGWTNPDPKSKDGFLTSLIRDSYNSAVKWLKDKLGIPENFTIDEVDAEAFIKDLLKSILPDRKGGPSTIGYWASKAVPEFLYNYIGDIAPSKGDFQSNGISGKKIEGGIFSSDKFQLTKDGKTINVSEEEYMKMQKLQKGGFRGLKLNVSQAEIAKKDNALYQQLRKERAEFSSQFRANQEKTSTLSPRMQKAERERAMRDFEIKFYLKNRDRLKAIGQTVEGEYVDNKENYFKYLEKKNAPPPPPVVPPPPATTTPPPTVGATTTDEVKPKAEINPSENQSQYIARRAKELLSSGEIKPRTNSTNARNAAYNKARMQAIQEWNSNNLQGSASTGLRDSQVENNLLKGEREAAADKAAVVVSTSGGNSSTSNVSSSTVNVSNDKDDDRASRAFTYNPVTAMGA